MALPAFDTHAYVKKLVSAGFNEKQAGAQAELQAQVLSSLVTEKLATKEDLTHLENEITTNMIRLESGIKSNIDRVESETKQRITEVTGKINVLTWMTGFLLASTVSIMFKLFLH